MDFNKVQQEVCEKYNSPFLRVDNHSKIGISLNVKEGILPLNGLRHPPEGDTTGWYIWAGEYSSDADFFVPLHVEHIFEWCPEIIKFLGLAPGWRFLMADNYEDVWEDLTLLDI